MKIIKNAIKISDLKIGDILVIKDQNDMHQDFIFNNYIDNITYKRYIAGFVKAMDELHGKSFIFSGTKQTNKKYLLTPFNKWNISIDMIKNLEE